MPALAAIVLRVAVVSGVAWFAWRFRALIATTFAYLGVVAILVTAYWCTTDLAPGHSYPDGPAPRAAAAAPASPVVVLVFDAFAHETLFDGSGHIDPSEYPNFAQLSQYSLTFTNATSNYFRTKTFFVYSKRGIYLKFSRLPGSANWSYDGLLHCDIGDRTGVMDVKPYAPTPASPTGCAFDAQLADAGR